MRNKIINWMLGVNNKLLTIISFISGVISLLYFIPKVADFAKEVYPTLNNDISKNIFSAVLDIELFIKSFQLTVYIGIVVFILSCIIIIIKIIYKDEEIINEVIIAHSSMSEVQFIPETYNKYKVEEINLVDDMRDIDNNYDNIKYAINKQDKFIEEIKRNIDIKYDYGYMGIAHTPLIFRIGNQLGDEVSIKLFHKYRTGNNKKFKELNNDMHFKVLQIEYEILNRDSNELIVGLATTFPIKIDELNVLKPNNKNIIIFKSEELGFDVITSKNQIDEYVKFITDKVRDIVKDKNINKVHMVLSTSVSMTFALGRAISKHHDPKVIIYHFDQNNQRKYTWGIDIFKKYNDCLIITKDSSGIS